MITTAHVTSFLNYDSAKQAGCFKQVVVIMVAEETVDMTEYCIIDIK